MDELLAKYGTPKVKTGDAFPMEPWVQHGWKNAFQMKSLMGKRTLIFTLPGAFTPT